MPKEATEIAIAISQPLKVENNQILDFLKVHIGDVVNKQTVLASKKGLFGLGGIDLKSPIEGIVHNIDLENGVIVINLGTHSPIVKSSLAEPRDNLITISKPSKSERTFHHTKYKRTASSNYETIEGIFGCGICKGTGWYIEYDFDSRSIVPEMQNRVILTSTMPDLSEIYKASAVGVAGMVIATDKIDARFLEEVRNDLTDKSHMGFLVLPGGTNLATLHGVLMEIDGESKCLYFEKK